MKIYTMVKNAKGFRSNPVSIKLLTGCFRVKVLMARRT